MVCEADGRSCRPLGDLRIEDESWRRSWPPSTVPSRGSASRRANVWPPCAGSVAAG